MTFTLPNRQHQSKALKADDEFTQTFLINVARHFRTLVNKYTYYRTFHAVL